MSDVADDVAIAVEAVQIRLGYAVGAVGMVVDPGRHTALDGRRVLVGMDDACGECDTCRRGGASVCPNTRRRRLPAGVQRLRAAARWVVALDDGLVVPGPAAAAIPYEVALAYTLYARAGVAPREPVIVFGDDAVARFLVEILIAKGIAPVVVADPAAAAWCAWLAARGASVAEVAPEGPAAGLTIARALAKHPDTAKSVARPWRVLAAGDLARAAGLANPRATLTVRSGLAEYDTGPALAGALSREVTVQGVAAPHPDLVLESAALVAKGEIDLAAGVVVRRADEPPPHDLSRADVVVS